VLLVRVRQDRLHLKAIEFTSYRGRRSREEATGTPSVTPVGTQIPDEPLLVLNDLARSWEAKHL
ncbi:MAG TPA: hypothetical protein VND64_08885, partial [Pirellulales bacterium]|nr:hypothetical protein [Pirellulales bacterium]